MINNKTLNRTISLVITGLLFTNGIFGQKAYFDFSLQYGLPVLGDLKTQQVNLEHYLGESILEEELIEDYFSVGKGFQANIALGIKFTDFISLRLRGNYFQGKNPKPFQRISTRYSYDQTESDVTRYTANGFGNNIAFSPMLMFHVPASEKVSMLMGVGSSFNFPFYRQADSIIYPFGDIEYFEAIYPRSLEIGFVGELGFIYAFNEKLSLKTGLQFNALNFTPKTAELIIAEFDGRNLIASFLEYQKEINYGSHSTTYDIINHEGDLEAQIDSYGVPRNATSFVVPFSNLNLEIGVVFGL